MSERTRKWPIYFFNCFCACMKINAVNTLKHQLLLAICQVRGKTRLVFGIIEAHLTIFWDHLVLQIIIIRNVPGVYMGTREIYAGGNPAID